MVVSHLLADGSKIRYRFLTATEQGLFFTLSFGKGRTLPSQGRLFSALCARRQQKIYLHEYDFLPHLIGYFSNYWIKVLHQLQLEIMLFSPHCRPGKDAIGSCRNDNCRHISLLVSSILDFSVINFLCYEMDVLQCSINGSSHLIFSSTKEGYDSFIIVTGIC